MIPLREKEMCKWWSCGVKMPCWCQSRTGRPVGDHRKATGGGLINTGHFNRRVFSVMLLLLDEKLTGLRPGR